MRLVKGVEGVDEVDQAIGAVVVWQYLLLFCSRNKYQLCCHQHHEVEAVVQGVVLSLVKKRAETTMQR